MMIPFDVGAGHCTIFHVLRGQRLGPPFEALREDSSDIDVFLEQDRAGRFSDPKSKDWAAPEDLQKAREQAAAVKQRQQAIRKPPAPKPPRLPEPKEPEPPAPPGAIVVSEHNCRWLCVPLRVNPWDPNPMTVCICQAVPSIQALLPHPMNEDELYVSKQLGLCFVLPAEWHEKTEPVYDPGKAFVNTRYWHNQEFGQHIRMVQVKDDWQPAPVMPDCLVNYTLMFRRGQQRTEAERHPATMVSRLERLEEVSR
jgi:hypothetical protein